MDQNSLSNATNATDLKKIFEIISITLTFFGCLFIQTILIMYAEYKAKRAACSRVS